MILASAAFTNCCHHRYRYRKHFDSTLSLMSSIEADLKKFSYSSSDFIPRESLILSLSRRLIISSVSKILHFLQCHPIASNPRFSLLSRRIDSNFRVRIYSLKLFSSDLQYLQQWCFSAYGFISYYYCV
jgi:hypothetical protein